MVKVYKDKDVMHQHMREYTNARYAQRLSKGLCVLCGGRPTQTGMSHCKPCADKNGRRSNERQRMLKERAVAYLGGKCVDCELQTAWLEVYDFHHRNPEEKDMTIRRMTSTSKSWEAIRKELDKCDLLCANCHRIRHAKEHRTLDE